MMKKIVFILLLLLLSLKVVSQEFTMHDTIRINKLKSLYHQLDFELCTSVLQRNNNEYINWQLDTLLQINTNISLHSPTFRTFLEVEPKINLGEMTKILMLAICFENMEEYVRGEDIYQHIILDSTRTVSIACVNREHDITYITDFYEIGDILNLKKYEKVLFHHGVRSDFLKITASYNPEIIVFCQDVKRCLRLMFIVGNDLYTVDANGQVTELGQAVNNSTNDFLKTHRYSVRREVESKYKKNIGCSDTSCACSCRVYNPYYPIARQQYSDYLPAVIKVGRTPRDMIRILTGDN